LLEAEDPILRMRAVESLGRFGGAAIDRYLGFALKDESAHVRRAAVRACEGHLHEGQLQTLMLALTDEDVEVRRMTAEVLGRSGFPQVVRPLELALQDEDLWVRAAAVRALGRIDGGGTLSVIRDALSDPVGLVVIAAIETLFEVTPETAVPDAVGLLEHADEEVVNAALQLLARSNNDFWLDSSCERLLNHRHWEVRAAFARLLAEKRPEQGRKYLEARLLIEGEELVRQQLQELLLYLQEAQG
jgi:HEAT repeat protein